MKIFRDLSLVSTIFFTGIFLLFCILENYLEIKLNENIVEADVVLLIIFGLFFGGSFFVCLFLEKKEEKKVWIREVKKYL